MGTKVSENLPCYLTGAASVGLALYFLVLGRNHLPLLFASAFLLVICLTDTFFSRIPNLLTVGLALAGFACQFMKSGSLGLVHAGLGLLVGLSLFLLPFMLGGMGGGDVKALAALGALLGPGAIFQVFLYTALCGGVLSVVYFLVRGDLLRKVRGWWASLYIFLASRDCRCLKPSFKGEALRFPYAAAIAFGYFAYLHWGRIL